MLIDMNTLLNEAADATSRFLNDELPRLAGNNWWERRVLGFLSRGQRETVERHGYSELSELDLAALLHTLDNNWRSIDDNHQFPPGALNYVKEMRTVRNRWSHVSADPEYIADDVYRDLDTLERFLSVVGAGKYLVEKVRTERLALAAEILKVHSPTGYDQMESSVSSAGQAQIPEEPASPSCPVCGNAMVRRTARTGPYAGNQFWGCSDWSVTGCNGIINLSKPQGKGSDSSPNCPTCQSSMVLRTARAGPHAGSQFWGCSEWGITGCSGLLNIEQDQKGDGDDLPS